MQNFDLLRSTFQSLSVDAKKEYLSKLTKDELLFLYLNPQVFLFDKQIPPTTPWRYHWFCGGRGSAKSFAGTNWLYSKIINGAQEVAIVAPTYSDLVKELLPTFESHFPPSLKPKFNHKDNLYKCFNGCIVKAYSSDTEIRGLNAEYAICDEMAKWCDSIPNKIQECFDVFQLGVRSNNAQPNPQIFITSTPKPFPFFINFEKQYLAKNPLYSMVRGQTSDNPYLSPAAKQAFYDQYQNTRLGRQELFAEILSDNPNALWNSTILEKTHLSQQLFDKLIQDKTIRVVKTVIAVDPAISTNPDSDETGIIVACLCSDNKVYIVNDSSGKQTPNEWANKVLQLYNQFKAAKIILEKNQGGDLLASNILSIDRYARIELIHASQGKQVRIEPIFSAYERGEIYHVGNLATLELQMLNFDPFNIVNSPDRIDAVAYAIKFLLIDQKQPVFRSINSAGNW